MIIKAYHPNGSPDLRRWQVQCDLCPARGPLIGSETWFIPKNPEMFIYCPGCADYFAMSLISVGLGCLGCGNPDLKIKRVGQHPGPHTQDAACEHCGSYFNPYTGWHFIDPPF